MENVTTTRQSNDDNRATNTPATLTEVGHQPNLGANDTAECRGSKHELVCRESFPCTSEGSRERERERKNE